MDAVITFYLIFKKTIKLFLFSTVDDILMSKEGEYHYVGLKSVHLVSYSNEKRNTLLQQVPNALMLLVQCS
jgi:hypothetical protein